jgi:lysophospholipase L1-like esterase
MVIRIPALGRLAIAAATFIVLALCAGGNLADAQISSPPSPSPSPAPAPAPASPVHAAFLGDSYTYGVGATVHTDGYAYLVARAEHWSAAVVGLPGSGYVRVALKDGKRIDSGIPSVIAAQPQIVIVECGRNDVDTGIALRRVKSNALRDLRALRAGLPNATIVVLGPVWLSGRPGRRVFAVRAAVHAAQRQIPHSLWIDPVGERWFTGRFDRRTGDDATMINYAVGHPDDLGYEHMARLLERDLRALGVR